MTDEREADYGKWSDTSYGYSTIVLADEVEITVCQSHWYASGRMAGKLRGQLDAEDLEQAKDLALMHFASALSGIAELATKVRWQ